MLKRCLQVRCKTSNYYILNFFLKNNFVYQDGYVGGVNKQMAAMLEKQSSPLETKLNSVFMQLFPLLRRPKWPRVRDQKHSVGLLVVISFSWV